MINYEDGLHNSTTMANYDVMAIRLSTAQQKRRKERLGSGAPRMVCFNRSELGAILNTYSRMVAAGKWRDYSISHMSRAAVFSVFRHSAEQPLYRIEKRPASGDESDTYVVIGMDQRILRRGNDLNQVMGLFARQLFRIV